LLYAEENGRQQMVLRMTQKMHNVRPMGTGDNLASLEHCFPSQIPIGTPTAGNVSRSSNIEH
jgi:hypothetical protein